MRNHAREVRDGWRNAILTTAASVAFAMPVFAGVLTAPVLAQSSASQSPTASAPANRAPEGDSLEAMETAGIEMEFDVASVKPNKATDQADSNFPLGPGDVYSPNGGLFRALDLPLVTYIAFAYRIQSNQMQDLLPQFPSWVTMDRFDIEAHAQGNPTKDQMRLMMQSLLADRFKLEIHAEIKQGPVYVLVLAKPGKTGPQLLPHKKDDTLCYDPDVQPVRAILPSTPVPVCGTLVIYFSPGEYSNRCPPVCHGLRLLAEGGGLTMKKIAANLSEMVSSLVVDRTGLSGTFDLTMGYTPEAGQPDPPPEAIPSGTEPSTAPPLFTALQEQLGLKLESAIGPIKVIVIDHIEEPAPN